jgi:hypothetical protein
MNKILDYIYDLIKNKITYALTRILQVVIINSFPRGEIKILKFL